jgi:hypothetical protein
MSIDTRINQNEEYPLTPEAVTPPEQITVTQILNDLEHGRDRKVIKAKYGLTAEEVKMIFEHPTLKGVRVKKARVVRFTLVDDTVDSTQSSTPTAPLEETSGMLYDGVDNTNVEVTSDNQTRVEAELDHKEEGSDSNFDIDELRADANRAYNEHYSDDNQTEIQD